MDEYISRKAVMDAYEEEQRRPGPWRFETLINSVPAADVAPVVRCRECEHYKEHRTKKYGNLICRCTRMGKYDMDYPVNPDDFCSYGESC